MSAVGLRVARRRRPRDRSQPDSRPPRNAYFRCTPYFRVPEGPHDWLNRTVVVGGGERKSNPDHSVFRYYAVL